ncbi:MAG: Uma2 family endonuclease [Planctomycetaceae bacterium]
MAAATDIQPGCVTFWDVSWEFYEQFLEEFKDRYVRHTYDDGVLEIMSPIGFEHERPKKLISWLIQALVEELEIPILCVGSMTLKNQRKAKGIEPDECFYVARESEMRRKPDYDPEHDPPPDLAIEIDWTSSSVPRMPVYARLGVPEVWRYAEEQLTVHCLNATGEYQESPQSLAFPGLPLDEFRAFIDRDPNVDETTWIRRFREWVRANLIK